MGFMVVDERLCSGRLVVDHGPNQSQVPFAVYPLFEITQCER